MAECIRAAADAPPLDDDRDEPLRFPGGTGRTADRHHVRRGTGVAVGFKNLMYSEGFDDFSTAAVRLEVGADRAPQCDHILGAQQRPGLRDQVAAVDAGQQRALGVFAQRWAPAPAGPLCLALWGVNDPGNVGTALRGALAFGASSVALGPGPAGSDEAVTRGRRDPPPVAARRSTMNATRGRTSRRPRSRRTGRAERSG